MNLMPIYITGSVVFYKNNKQDVLSLLKSVIECNSIHKLYIIDNSPTETIQSYIKDLNLGRKEIEYIHNPRNTGFGAAHNIALDMVCPNSDYHVILNPDITFPPHTVSHLIEFMSKHRRAGICMPQIFNTDGTIQYLPKLFPTPLNFAARRLPLPTWIKDRINAKYELRQASNDKPFKVNIISGCFMLIRNEVLTLGVRFDPRYFMYFEDFDLCRTISETHDAYLVPNSQATHGYARASKFSKKMLFIALNSGRLYFNKWGWLLDRDRRLKNQRILGAAQSITKNQITKIQ